MPRDSPETGPARLSPSYVGYLLIAEAVGAANKSRLAPLLTPDNENLAVYGVWEGARGPSRIVALNMQPWNGTAQFWDWNSTVTGDGAAQQEQRPAVVLDLSRFNRNMVVKSRSTPYSTGHSSAMID